MTRKQKLEQTLKEIERYVNLVSPEKPKKKKPEPNLDQIIRAATKNNISYGRAMALYHLGRMDLDGNMR